MSQIGELRFISHLAPGIPEAYFEELAAILCKPLGARPKITFTTNSASPMTVGRDPLSSGHVDVGFLGATAYVWLKNMDPCPVEMLDAAPVWDDPRGEGKPVSFGEVIAIPDGGLDVFADLEGCLFGYNSIRSLTGYYMVLRYLDDHHYAEHFFSGMVETGSHPSSIEKVIAEDVDAVCIDAQVLKLAMAADPSLQEKIKVIATLGPYPVQPILVRADLSDRIKQTLTETLLGMSPNGANAGFLKRYGLQGFAAPQADQYTTEALLTHFGP